MCATRVRRLRRHRQAAAAGDGAGSIGVLQSGPDPGDDRPENADDRLSTYPQPHGGTAPALETALEADRGLPREFT